jgi:hypothetical protein
VRTGHGSEKFPVLCRVKNGSTPSPPLPPPLLAPPPSTYPCPFMLLLLPSSALPPAPPPVLLPSIPPAAPLPILIPSVFLTVYPSVWPSPCPSAYSSSCHSPPSALRSAHLPFPLSCLSPHPGLLPAAYPPSSFPSLCLTSPSSCTSSCLPLLPLLPRSPVFFLLFLLYISYIPTSRPHKPAYNVSAVTKCLQKYIHYTYSVLILYLQMPDKDTNFWVSSKALQDPDNFAFLCCYLFYSLSFFIIMDNYYFFKISNNSEPSKRC